MSALKSSTWAGPMADSAIPPKKGMTWSSIIWRLLTTLECLLLFSL
jgi:hypothetical protein